MLNLDRSAFGVEEAMSADRSTGTVYWIDHFVVGTNDLLPWIEYAECVLGGAPRPVSGLTTESRLHRGPIFCFVDVGDCHAGAFLQQNEPLPPTRGLGTGLPRYGFFIRQEDVERQLRRLDDLGVLHAEAVRTGDLGDDGTSIVFQDPDGNQCELWAPVRMPDGAMDHATSAGVGRISHAVLESRDLRRTTDFMESFCTMQPLGSGDVRHGVLAYGLAGGGRLIFQQVEELETRTRGFTRRGGLHTALTVQADDFLPTYKRMWDALPEWDYNSRGGRPAAGEVDEAALPARTALHGSGAGRRWKELYGRGDDFYDWDTNCYHLVGGVPVEGSMAHYAGRYMEDYVADVFGKAEMGD
ncbi:MAG: hypothetical protein HW416_1303 [Chloroflexi bacterium]|nr:hypothetical protein [Chloroflexota bacterium]